MNKDLLDQLPTDEQPLAAKLSSAAEDMKLSPDFQWTLETQLMDAYKSKTESIRQNWPIKIVVPVAWALVALCGVLLLNWTVRSLVPVPSSAAPGTTVPKLSFPEKIRQGNVCANPLALAHGFGVFLTKGDKTGFIRLAQEEAVGEVRSIAWSPDGQHLAIIGNTAGRGNILITNPDGGGLEYLLSSSEVGYTMDAAWSRDSKQFVIWSSQNNRIVYLLNANGSGLIEKKLDIQILGTPQFTPDSSRIVFYGADESTAGLFEVRLEDAQTRRISARVENESGYAFSPDGSHLAYIEMDRDLGEARLLIEEIASASKVVLATLPIPKGSGSTLPETANLSWSADGKWLVFDFGRGATERAVYLASVDTKELVKLADKAHAPAISADGKCLAYISNQQVFLMDLTGTSQPSNPLLLADLPAGRGKPNFQLDKLQWRP